jgi:indole-3-glycerol phosphate synthase
MSNILEEILRTKRAEVDAAARQISLTALQDRVANLPPTRDFVGALRAKHSGGKAAVIAEIKKKSPSAGQFRADGDFDPARFAASYEAHGAACLSVLTDGDYFGGCSDDLAAARSACALPVLRKDFIVDAYQIYEARAMGADAVLFIMDALPIDEFRRLELIATGLGLAVLAESHTAEQLQQALLLTTPLIGINNRDLTRFKTNLETTTNLAPLVPETRIVITESGVENCQAVDFMRKNGVNTFLVGGALMREQDPGAALALLFPS